MVHPNKFNAPDGTAPKCPVCDKRIHYPERTKHEGVWKHQACAGIGTLKHMLDTVAELGFGDDRTAEAHCLAILACMNVDDDSGYRKAAELSKLEPEFIAKAMQPLIDQGVFKDGIWHVDSDVDLEDGRHCAIQILMWTLCSQGLVRRERGGGAADPGVP